MGQFDNLILTDAGVELIVKAQSGGQLVFTKMAIGDGNLPGGTELSTLTELIQQRQIFAIQDISIADGYTKLTTIFSNEQVTEGYFVRELGIFANDPDEGEILFAVANAGEHADWLPEYGGAEAVQQKFEIAVTTSNVANVMAVFDQTYLHTFGKVKVGSTVIQAETPVDTLELAAGANISLTPDAAGDKVTIAVNDGTGSGLDADLFDGRDSARYIFGDDAFGSTETADPNAITKSGFYFLAGNMNAPTSATAWIILHAQYGTDAASFQIATRPGSSNLTFWRRKATRIWSNWYTLWTSENDGSGSGLDADLIKGLTDSVTSHNGSGTNTYLRTVKQVADLNNIVGNMVYFESANTPANSPITSGFVSGIQFYLASNPSYKAQLACSGGGYWWVRSQAADIWIPWQRLWHSGNDGAGSGLDADTLDGMHATTFARNVAKTSNGDGSNPNTWTKIASINIQNVHNDFGILLGIAASASPSGSLLVNVSGRKADTGYINLRVNIIGKGGAVQIPDSGIKLVGEAGGPLELWIQKADAWGSYGISELVKQAYGGTTTTYFSDQPWQSTEPTGTYSTTSSGLVYGTVKIWHENNDGAGSGLDADTVDSKHLSDLFCSRTSLLNGSATDLNTIIDPGCYHVGHTSETPLNFPANTYRYGTLLVSRFGSSVTQIYFPNNQESQGLSYQGFHVRTTANYNTTWPAWEKVWTTRSDGSGSGLDADTLDGKHASELISQLTGTSNLQSNGYQRFPSGLLLQWGSVTSGGNVVFPISFTTCFSVVIGADTGNQANDRVNSITATGFRISGEGCWLAIGVTS